jgi:serine/threonine-protein kinase RsbW
MARVVEAVAGLRPDSAWLERLKTAVSEATMNAIEHGNRNQPDLEVAIRVAARPDEVVVRIRDHGGGRPIPEVETPDIEAKLAGEQNPRGWGLFLIENMVDEMNVSSDETHHTIELCMKLKGNGHGN